jgi:hypothetical protein
MDSVLQDWVMELPRREQGTLLTGVRGCDVAPKRPVPADDFYIKENGRAQSTERELTAFLRWCFMNPADEREVDIPGSFFKSEPPADWRASEFGHYPQHWYSHLMHSFEVIAYRHPSMAIRTVAWDIYSRLVHNMHLNTETFDQFVTRLSEDRIATGNVVS